MGLGNLLEPGGVSRREFLGGVGTLLAGGAAGCAGNGGKGSGPVPTEESTETPTETPEPTPTPVPTPTEPYSVKELGEIDETGTLNLVPADPDAVYAESVIFTSYNGEIDVEIDLEKAHRERHIQNEAGRAPVVQNFVDPVINENQEWFKNLHQEYIKMMNGKSDGGFPKTVNFDKIQNEELNLAERWIQSNLKKNGTSTKSSTWTE